MTPFATEKDWDFLDKYFVHKPVSNKSMSNDSLTECHSFRQQTGTTALWRAIKRLEFVDLKYLHCGQRFGMVRENLQMYIDECVWRFENRSSARKVEALVDAFHF